MGFLSITRLGIAARWLATALLLLLAGLLAAVGGSKSASAGQAAGGGTVAFAPQFAVADFDGDQHPDFASVRASGNSRDKVLYWIDFRLSTGSTRTVGVTAAAGGVQLASRDVNGDHFLDVVVTSPLTGEPIAVLLNDGQGNFTRSEPAAFPEAFQNFDFSVAAKTSRNEDRLGAVSPRPLATNDHRRGWFLAPHDCLESAVLESNSPACASGREACRGRAPPALA